MKAKKKKSKKIKEQQGYQFSAEAAERFDRWMEESNERWSKQEQSIDNGPRILIETFLAFVNFSNWDISCKIARSEGKTYEEIVIPQLNAQLEKSISEIPKQVDEIFEKFNSEMEKSSEKIRLN